MGFLANIADIALAPITAAGNFISKTVLGVNNTGTTPQDLTSSKNVVVRVLSTGLGDAVALTTAPLAVAISPLAGSVAVLATGAAAQSTRLSDTVSKAISQAPAFSAGIAKTIDAPNTSSAIDSLVQTAKDNPYATGAAGALLAYFGLKAGGTLFNTIATAENTKAANANTAATQNANNPLNSNPATTNNYYGSNPAPIAPTNPVAAPTKAAATKAPKKKKKAPKKVAKKKSKKKKSASKKKKYKKKKKHK